MTTTLSKKIFTISFSISVLSIVSALIAQSFLPPQVPLYYGLPVGEEQLSSSLNLIVPGIVSLLILAVNFTLVKIAKEDFIKKVLAVVALIASFFAIITTFKIIFLVGSF
ncbi:MAG: hypothetical protein Q8P91_02075 [bacterium]|nr:hypothetical protein [bacterium]